MEKFHVIEGAQVILYRKGVYSQSPLYMRGDQIYAKVGNGFVLIYANEKTSHPDIRWKDMEQPYKLIYGAFGRLKLTLTPAGNPRKKKTK